MESPILQGLNPAQRAAVEAYDSASLIIAGAGSGKTRVLTSRIAYMIQKGIKPKNILATTFTNKAAQEMRERIVKMIPEHLTEGQARHIWMGTFHSIFARILRTDAERIGFPTNFTIYDASDARNLIKTIVKELNLADDKYKPNTIASRISQAKNALVTPGAYLANSAHATEDRRAQIPEFGNIYNLYCQRCKHNGAMDFDDLLLQTNILLRDCPDVLERYQEQFKYILVDEYQDTNYAQYIIVRRLSQHHGKVCVVGDDAQSIYSFRGAKIENILSFQRDYPEAKVFKLEQNYRSTRTIVEAANSVIVHNSRRMEKRCFSEGDEGEKIRVLKAYTDREEAELVVQDLRDKVRATGDAWNEAAILYRTNNQSQALEESLRRRGIPYRIYKGASFYDRKEIKDMLAYIRLVVNPRDDEAFRRIVNYPVRGIGDTTVLRIAQLAAERGVSMWEAVDALVAEPVSDPVQRTIVRKVAEFVALIRSLSLERAQKGLYDFGMEVASRSGILALFRRENSPEATSALDNIEELLNSMQLFKEQRDAEIRAGEELGEATVEEWLQSVTLTTDMDKKEDAGDDDKVTLMTVHSAKGLEFKYVYIVGMEENLFPSQRAAESPEGFEEERRLFYVALTRAKCSAPRCGSSGATWSFRVRAVSCARSTPAISTVRSGPARRPCAKRPQPAAARRSKSCAGVSTCVISSGRAAAATPPSAVRNLRSADGAEPIPAVRGRRAAPLRSAGRAGRIPPSGVLRCNAPLCRRICGGWAAERHPPQGTPRRRAMPSASGSSIPSSGAGRSCVSKRWRPIISWSSSSRSTARRPCLRNSPN